MESITKGTVVQLISGGPQMSVSALGDYSTFGAGPKDGAKCVWFDAKNNRCEEVFDVAILKEYVAPSSSGRLTRG